MGRPQFMRSIAALLTPAVILFAQAPDTSHHTIRLVEVEKGIHLEVLDWGGNGRNVILLAGLGDTAHVFDAFAGKLTGEYHVYGITRRGFGGSSVPRVAEGVYAADRLGDDVLAVIHELKIDRPVLIGHSIAGQEMSSIGSRHPEAVAGLVYLDAGYDYAFYDPAVGDLNMDLIELERRIGQVRPGSGPNDKRPLIEEMLRSLALIEKDLKKEHAFLDALPDSMLAGSSQTKEQAAAIIAGERKYTHIEGPVLAIFAVPHDMGAALNRDAEKRAAFEAEDAVYSGTRADAFARGVPQAKVVRLPRASHYVFRSNGPEILKEIGMFIDRLP